MMLFHTINDLPQGCNQERANRAIAPQNFANMMAFTCFTRNVISRDCVTSTWTSSQDNSLAHVCAASYIGCIKLLTNQCTHASENSQPRPGKLKLWGASCEMKPFHQGDVVIVNVISQSKNPYDTNRGYCYTKLPFWLICC